jgi:hypothetical protein
MTQLTDWMDSMLVAGGVCVLLFLVLMGAWMYPPLHEAKKMDCALAEFSPDISTEIKQLCREARMSK